MVVCAHHLNIIDVSRLWQGLMRSIRRCIACMMRQMPSRHLLLILAGTFYNIVRTMLEYCLNASLYQNIVIRLWHSVVCMWQTMCCMWRTMCCMWQTMCCMWQRMCCIWQTMIVCDRECVVCDRQCVVCDRQCIVCDRQCIVRDRQCVVCYVKCVVRDRRPPDNCFIIQTWYRVSCTIASRQDELQTLNETVHLAPPHIFKCRFVRSCLTCSRMKIPDQVYFCTFQGSNKRLLRPEQWAQVMRGKFKTWKCGHVQV